MPERGVHRTPRRVVRADGVELCVQTFGDRAAPAVLLIAGLSSSMDWWEEGFCERLAAGPRFVIRYDHRDTGQSVTSEPGDPHYSGSDLVADAVGLLDTLRISRAHVVGISAGGGIGQHLALDHPARVASLTLISTSPLGPRQPGSRDLPPMTEELAAVFAAPPPRPDWSDRAAVIAYIVDDLRPYAGTFPFDEEASRELAGSIFDRTADIESSFTNHWVLDEGEPPRRRLDELTAPTLVLHGTEDPFFPFAHGEALADAIPGAQLVPLEGVGHEMPPRPVWDDVVAAILHHTATG